MTRRQSPACVSDLQLDRLLAGELRGSEAEALRAHVTECEFCGAQQGALEVEQRAIQGQLPELKALLQRTGSGSVALQGAERMAVRRRSAPQRLWLGAGSLAAALALWVASERPASEGGAEREGAGRGGAGRGGNPLSGTRTKGGAALQLDWVVRRGAEVFAASASDPVQPGDALRFGVRTSAAGYAAVLSLDGAGRTSVYQDWVSVTAGERQLLPGAVELDGVLGDEHLYGLVCEHSLPLAAFEDAIRRAPARPDTPAGCAVDAHVVRKEAP